MKRLLALLLALALLAVAPACVPEDEEETGADEEYQVVPSAKTLSIDVPDSEDTGGLIGETAEFYNFTRGVSFAVNVRAAIILGTLDFITAWPATTSGEDYRIWGPSEPKGLEKNSWRLVVKKIDENRFSFSLEGRSKESTSEDDFLPTLIGEVTPGATKGTGVGSLQLLFDNSYELESDLCSQGIIRLDWDNTGTDRVVDVYWEDYVNLCDEDAINDAEYHYIQHEDYAGSFEFSTSDNIHTDAENKPELETAKIKSRWMANGAGRSDVYLSGGEVATDLEALGFTENEIQMTQCWNEFFASVYETSAPDEMKAFLWEEAGEIGECVYTEAEFPSL